MRAASPAVLGRPRISAPSFTAPSQLRNRTNRLRLGWLPYRQPLKSARILVAEPPPVKHGGAFGTRTTTKNGAGEPAPFSIPHPGLDETLGDLLIGLDRRCLLRLRRRELLVPGRRELTPPRHHAARAGGDQAADDDVLLEARQHVDPPGNRRLGEDAGGFLEGRGRDEGI